MLKWSHPGFQTDIKFLEDWCNVGGDLAKSEVVRHQRWLEKMLQSLAERTSASICHVRQEILEGNGQLLEGLEEAPDDEDDSDGDHEPALLSAVQRDRFEDSERFTKIVDCLLFSVERRIGVTLSGRVGSFLKDAREGDEVCLIAGAPARFVVRKAVVESSPNSEEFGGENAIVTCTVVWMEVSLQDHRWTRIWCERPTILTCGWTWLSEFQCR